MAKIRFGLAGCGHIGKVHAAEIAALPGAELAAVCDADPATVQGMACRYGVPGFSDYAKMLEQKGLDVIAICTPSGLHTEMGVMAARSGRHVLVEKPMALTLEDADRLIETCQKEGVLLSVVLQNRFKPPFQLLKAALEKGRFGRLSHAGATIRWNRDQSYFESNPWRGKKAGDGGVMMNQAIHSIDLLQWLMGPAEQVFAYTATRYRPIEAEDVGVAALKFRSGALGLIEAASTVYPRNLEETIAVFGEKGTAVIGGVKTGEIKTWSFAEDDGPPSAAVDPVAGKKTGHRAVLLDLVKALRSGARLAVDGREGRKSLEIVLAIYRSSETGRPVFLKQGGEGAN